MFKSETSIKEEEPLSCFLADILLKISPTFFFCWVGSGRPLLNLTPRQGIRRVNWCDKIKCRHVCVFCLIPFFCLKCGLCVCKWMILTRNKIFRKRNSRGKCIIIIIDCSQYTHIYIYNIHVYISSSVIYTFMLFASLFGHKEGPHKSANLSIGMWYFRTIIEIRAQPWSNLLGW